MASGRLLVLVVEAPGPFVEFEVPPFIIVLLPNTLALAALRVNGVDSRLFRFGSTKSTLLPCVRSVISLFCDVEFLKRASSLDCMTYELSAWPLLIVSILVSRLHNLMFTVSYRWFISRKTSLIFFSFSLSVASILSEIFCSFPSVALA